MHATFGNFKLMSSCMLDSRSTLTPAWTILAVFICSAHKYRGNGYVAVLFATEIVDPEPTDGISYLQEISQFS